MNLRLVSSSDHQVKLLQLLKRLYISPDVEYNVTSGISLGDASIEEFCGLQHPSVGMDLLGSWLQWFVSCKEYVVKATSFRRSSVCGLTVGGLDTESEEGI